MSAYATFYLPEFVLQAVLRATPEMCSEAVGLLAQKTSKAQIIALTARAAGAGVTRGMSATQALARCPGLIIKMQSADAERTARETLLECALSFSPWVEDTAEGICTLRWGGGQPEQARAALLQRGLHGRVGIGPNPDLALLAAQSTQTWRIISSALELGPLPVEMLGPAAPLMHVLQQWGIRTVAAFTALGREALVQRLGAEVLPLFERATGALERPLRCIVPLENFEENIEWEQEIETLEPLLFILRRFLERLALRLGAVWLVAAGIELQLGFRAGPPYERLFEVPAPTLDVEVLFRMLHTHLENFRAEHPIRSLSVRALPGRPARRQFSLFESALRDPNQFYETLARLGALLGNERVGTPALVPTHRPDAFRMGPVSFGEPPKTAPAGLQPLVTGLLLRRFRPPVNASVEMADTPRFVRSAPASGPVGGAYGPVLLSGCWWDGAPWSRHEWDVQLRNGPLCRIYLEAGAWFLEGIYD